MGRGVTTQSRVDAFYSDPNEVDPVQIGGAPGELLGLLLSRLETSVVRTLLPARVGGTTRWYGFAPTEREARLLREEIRCWLGPPISSHTVNVGQMPDALDRTALQLVPSGSVIRVDVADGWQGDARSNVASLTDVWALAPERGVDQPRPVGRVLRQFYESLLAADREQAQAALDEIKSRSLLNSTNLRFLRVEMLSTLGSPEEIRDDPTLRDISQLARPLAVTEQIAAAANALLIEPELAVHGPGVDWNPVANALENAWPGLVTHLEQITNLVTARCFALRELISSEPRRSILNEVGGRFSDDSVVAATTSVPVGELTPQKSTTALSLYHDGDYWAALQTAESEPLARSTVSVALAASVNLGDSASAVRALALLDALPGEDRDQLLAMSVEETFYEQLLARTSNACVPNGWLDWLRADWADRPDLLTEWARLWSRTPEDLNREAELVAEELLDGLNDQRRGRVRNGLPVFIEWLVRDGLPPSGLGLATTVFDILLSSEPGRTERQASLVLLEEVLLVGCASHEYVELADAVSRQIPQLGPRDAMWLSQCLDLFLLFTSVDPSRRELLFSMAAGVVASWWERLEPADAAVLQLVFAGAGVAITTPIRSTEPASNEGVTRQFGSVGIYSLLESATRVATGWIQKLYPNVEIKSSSEHVNSRSLTAMVRSCDVTLVQTSHAKHAATEAIEAASQNPSHVVLVHGRGATALVRALLAWANGETISQGG